MSYTANSLVVLLSGRTGFRLLRSLVAGMWDLFAGKGPGIHRPGENGHVESNFGGNHGVGRRRPAAGKRRGLKILYV